MKVSAIKARPENPRQTTLQVLVDTPYPEIANLIKEAQEKPYEIALKPIRQKRSLDANGYYWTLLSKLAEVLGTSREELHTQMIHDYGAIKLDEDGDMCKFYLEPGKDPEYIAKYSMVAGEDEIDGDRVLLYVVLKGSSEMDTKEFSHLLDCLIQECKDQGIPTATPQELAMMEHYEQVQR